MSQALRRRARRRGRAASASPVVVVAVGDPALPEPVGQAARRAPPTRRASTANASVPVTRPTSAQTTSSQDCGVACSGVSDRRQKPAPGRRAEVARASRPRGRASRAAGSARSARSPRATMTPTEISRMPPTKTSSATPEREVDDHHDERRPARSGTPTGCSRSRAAPGVRRGGGRAPARSSRGRRGGHGQGLRHGINARNLGGPARSCQPDSPVSGQPDHSRDSAAAARGRWRTGARSRRPGR